MYFCLTSFPTVSSDLEINDSIGFKIKVKGVLNSCEILVKNIKQVLSKAISMGGSTIKDFVNAEGKPGYFTQELLVYKKKYCPIHKKNLISNIKISGRSSFFCDKCQKL